MFESAQVNLKKSRKYDVKIAFTEHWYKSKGTLGSAPPVEGKFDKAVELTKNSDAVFMVIGSSADIRSNSVFNVK